MKRIFEYTIPAEYDGVALLMFLKDRHYSAATITHLKRTKDGIQLNGTWTTVKHLLHTGDVLTVLLTEDADNSHIVPSGQLPDIIYEDADILVVNKPADMPIHPSQGNYDNTLANAVMHYFHSKGEIITYRCINRLDRDTTGLLILAKHMHSASILSSMVSRHMIQREYLAIVTGITDKSGLIDAPIARRDGSTIEREVNFTYGEPARTHYRRLACHDGYSLLSVRLETGRTHQIRVHMKHIGHPIPGDFLYHPNYDIIKRQALHSYRLTFAHPITGKELCFTAPLPADMHTIFPSY